MIYTKKLSDYALAGGSGMGKPTGWGGEGVYSQLNAMSFSPAGGYSQRSGMAGMPFMDNTPGAVNSRMAIDKQMNKMLGIQTAPGGVMGAPSGIGGGIAGMNVVTPKIMEKTQAWMQSKQAEDLATEKREVAKLQAIGEVYNNMLGSVKDSLSLETLKQSEQFQALEKQLSDQIAKVYGEQEGKTARYVTPDGDLKKVPKKGSKTYLKGQGDEKVTILEITMGKDGVPKVKVKKDDGTEGVADIDDLIDTPDTTRRMSFIPLD